MHEPKVIWLEIGNESSDIEINKREELCIIMKINNETWGAYHQDVLLIVKNNIIEYWQRFIQNRKKWIRMEYARETIV